MAGGDHLGLWSGLGARTEEACWGGDLLAKSRPWSQCPAEGPPSWMMVEWLNGETTGRKGRSGVQGPRAGTESGPTPAVPPQRAGGRSECSGRCLLHFLPLGEPRRLSPSWVCVGISSMRPGARSRRDGDGLAPTPCVQAKCFDPLVRGCVACNLLRTPDPRPGKSQRIPTLAGRTGEAEGAATTEGPSPRPPERRLSPRPYDPRTLGQGSKV